MPIAVLYVGADGFYPDTADGLVKDISSCLSIPSLRRLLGLWNLSM